MNRLKRPGRALSPAIQPISLILAIIAGCAEIWAQGPNVSYYYHPQTELAWARCEVYLQGGSRQKLPFLPVICSSYRHAPMGMGNYAKDIAVDGHIVFIGNGISSGASGRCYEGRRQDYTVGDIDVSGCIVLLCPDANDAVEAKLGQGFPLSRRIVDAAVRKAAAVVVSSWAKPFPFYKIDYEKEADIPDIPVISVTRSSVLDILASAGLDGETLLKDWAASGHPPESQVLISRLSLKIKGAFDKTETKNFLFRYDGDTIPRLQMNELAEVNERALAFLQKLFAEDKKLKWDRLPAFYFRDYDAKVFYTHHWGLGWATPEGTYMVHEGGTPNFPLAAHENAHVLIDRNWGGSSSFLCEGIGKYAEAQAEDRDKNDRQTIEYLKAGKLFSLKEMLAFNIGMPGLQTDVGYPAAGSFVGYLIQARGLRILKDVYLLVARSSDAGVSDGPWLKALGKPLADVQRDWLSWLAKTHREDAAAIRGYIDRRSKEK